MALTTHEKIRVEAGFQSRDVRQEFLNSPGSGVTVFFVKSDLNYKIVPDFNTGATIAGISDVEVYVGLSGVYGSSKLWVSSVDVEQGSVGLSAVVPSGASLTISYASSAISSRDIENARLRAESIVNQRLSLCYDLPLSPIPSQVESMATRLAASLLLIRGYGTGSLDTANDGYRLYEQLMGRNELVTGGGFDASSNSVVQVGEIGLICTTNYQLVDDSGTIIPRNDDDTATTGDGYVVGGNVEGRLHVIQDEEVRFKDPKSENNKAGTQYNPARKTW